MTPTEESHQRTLHDYLALASRRKWVIILATVVTAVAAFVLSSQNPDVYRGSAEVLLSRQSASNLVTGVSNPDLYIAPDRYAETQAGLARAPEVARRAIAAAGAKLSIGSFLADSSVTPAANADLLKFEVSNASPSLAAKLTDAYATAFTDYRTDLDTAQLKAAYTELQNRLAQLRSAGQGETQLYRDLAQSAQQLRTMELLQTRNLVVRPAGDASHVAPTPKRTAMLGAALGLLLGIGLAFAWDALDRRVRTEEEIERALDLPLLTRIPAPPRHLRSEGRLVMLDEPQDAHAEAIRRLRTNLEFANVDNSAQVVLVTSAIEEEGKSTTVANLAVALARAGRRVALVDLDLRRPMLGDLLGTPGQAGITDVALGHRSLDEALHAIPLPGQRSLAVAGAETAGAGLLALVPAGTLPANPGEFVGSRRLADVIEDLRSRAEFILIDAPPVLAVGDAMTLSARVDGILVVTRLGMVDRRNIAELARELHRSPARKLGFVVTGIDLKGHYGYGYGYPDDERPAPTPTDPSHVTVQTVYARRPTLSVEDATKPARSARAGSDKGSAPLG